MENISRQDVRVGMDTERARVRQYKVNLTQHSIRATFGHQLAITQRRKRQVCLGEAGQGTEEEAFLSLVPSNIQCARIHQQQQKVGYKESETWIQSTAVVIAKASSSRRANNITFARISSRQVFLAQRCCNWPFATNGGSTLPLESVSQ